MWPASFHVYENRILLGLSWRLPIVFLHSPRRFLFLTESDLSIAKKLFQDSNPEPES